MALSMDKSRKSPMSHPISIFTIAVLAAFAMSVAAYALRSRVLTNDFAHYYVSSRAWLEHRDPYSTLFVEEFRKYQFIYDPRIPTASNPPALIVAFAGFALLPPVIAFYGWFIVQVFSLGLTFVAIHRLVPGRHTAQSFSLVVLALTLCTATSEHFWFSQVQLQLGALLLLAYVSQRQGRYSRSWSLVMIAACLKIVPVVMLPWLVWSAPGRWRTKVTWLVPPAVLLGTIVAVTWSLWRGFLETGVDVIRGNVANRMFNYSLPSFAINLASSVFNPAQTPGASDVLWILGVTSGGLLIAAAYIACWRSRCSDETAFCVLLLVTIVAAPTAWVHYFVLAFFPFVVLVAAMRRNPSPARVGLVLAVYLGMMNVGRLDFLTDNPTFKVLVSYVPLYAVLVLIVWFVRTDGGRDSAPVDDQSATVGPLVRGA